MYSLFLYFDLGANGGIKCKTKLIGQLWAVWTSFRNLGITLSSELQLRWFKMLWKAKNNLYNFHILSFEKYGLHQGANGGIKCKTKLIGQFWAVWTSFRNLGITLSSELQLRWFKMLWNAKTYLYNFHVLSFDNYWLYQGRNQAWSYCSYMMKNKKKIN